jgi:hypothetical protein
MNKTAVKSIYQYCSIFIVMTICEFLALSETEQADLEWANFHIAEREEGHNWILLYQIDAFYVELHYNLTLHEITGIYPFVCTSHLEPYLQQIPLPDFI